MLCLVSYFAMEGYFTIIVFLICTGFEPNNMHCTLSPWHLPPTPPPPPPPRSTSVRNYFKTEVVTFVQKLVDSYSKWACSYIQLFTLLLPHLLTPLSLSFSPSLLCGISPKLRISFITFDDIVDVVVQLPLTSNRAKMQAAIESLKDVVPIGTTHLGPAISEVSYCQACYPLY